MKVGDLIILTPYAIKHTASFRLSTGNRICTDQLANRTGILLSREKVSEGFILTIGFGNTVVRAYQDYFEKV